MNIQALGRTSPALNEVVQERLLAALGQHDEWVESVSVRFWDVNGPRGGEDQQCKVEVRLRGNEVVTIEERDIDPYAVISLAADRAKQAVGRRVDRLRERAP